MYNINKSNGEFLVAIEEGTSDSVATSLTLIGKNYSNYGEVLNENLVRITENFTSYNPPASPLKGQLWYDDTDKILKLWNGDTWTAAGSGVQLDQESTAVHFVTFVQTEYGAPPLKVAGNKGIVFEPASGNMAIGKSSRPTSKLEINGNTAFNRVFAAPVGGINETIVHLHGDDTAGGKSARLVIDSYGFRPNERIGSVLHLRRSRGTSGSRSAVIGNDILGGIAAHGYDGASFSEIQGYINFQAAENWNQNAHGTKLEIWLTQAKTLLASRVVEITSSGDIKAEGDIVAYTSSDITLKTNVRKITNALSKVLTLDGIIYRWDAEKTVDKDLDRDHAGLNAQQVLQALPEAVVRRKNGTLAVNYEMLVPLLIESIKELEAKLSEIEGTRKLA